MNITAHTTHNPSDRSTIFLNTQKSLAMSIKPQKPSSISFNTQKPSPMHPAKFFLLLLFIGFTSFAFAGGQKYQQKMAETLEIMGQAQSPEDFQKAANQFLIIAKAEKQEWLPYYYHAYGYVLSAFMYEGQAELQDRMLDEAGTSLQELLDMAGDNAEVHALKALHTLARMVVNAAERGATYSPQIQAAVREGLAIDPTNPRLRYVKLSTDLGTAEFFGTDVSEYCDTASQLLAEWDDFELESPLHPSWGKDQVVAIIQQKCGSEK